MKTIYKTFTFEHNPSKLHISYSRDIKLISRPYAGGISQDYQLMCRVVKGEGAFCGKNALLQFMRLKAHIQTGTGVLQLPGFQPFYAFFRELEFIGCPGRELVRYTFEFVEDTSTAYPAATGIGPHTVAAGESVWDISEHYGVSVERILERNPALDSLCELAEGTVILL